MNESLDCYFQIFNHFFDILLVEKIHLTRTDRSDFFKCLKLIISQENINFLLNPNPYLNPNPNPKIVIFTRILIFHPKHPKKLVKFKSHVTYLEPISWSITTIASKNKDNLWFLSLDYFQNFRSEFIVLCSSICKHINIRIVFFDFISTLFSAFLLSSATATTADEYPKADLQPFYRSSAILAMRKGWNHS